MALPTVLLADLPPMLEDLLSGMLKDHLDVEIAHDVSRDELLANTAAARGASVVVVGRSDPGDLGSVDASLLNATEVPIVAVGLDGASACLHSVRPHRRFTSDVSARQIVNAIFDAMAKRGH